MQLKILPLTQRAYSLFNCIGWANDTLVVAFHFYLVYRNLYCFVIRDFVYVSLVHGGYFNSV